MHDRLRFVAVSDIWQGPTKWIKKIANTTSGLGVSPPKRKFFDAFLTSTKVHLVEQISSEGRTEGLLTFPQVWGVLIT